MNQILRQPQEVYVDPLDALYERALARAYLWSIGEYSLHEAVDALQASAVRDDLVERMATMNSDGIIDHDKTETFQAGGQQWLDKR